MSKAGKQSGKVSQSDANRARDKIGEFAGGTMVPVEKAAAKARQGTRTDLVETFHEVKTPQKTRDKIGEQRKFVLWWDGQEKDKGGGDVRNTRRSAPTGVVKASDFGLDFGHRRNAESAPSVVRPYFTVGAVPFGQGLLELNQGSRYHFSSSGTPGCNRAAWSLKH